MCISILGITLLMTWLLLSCRYNQIQSNAAQTQSIWSEFLSQEQRKVDLIAALSRLFFVSEPLPTLKTNRGFIELQPRLKVAENEMNLARYRFIKEVQTDNFSIRLFPLNGTARLFEHKTDFNIKNKHKL